MKKIYFWCKPATKPERDEEDKLNFYEVKEDQSIREIIRSLETKIIGNRKDFSEVKPVNPSVKKWIENTIKKYPERNDNEVEDLINEFRSVLYTKSKEKEKFIVGVLQLNDVFVIVHCKKGPSLAEIKDELYSVKTILHPKNIVRADIIKNEDGKLTLAAFEYSRKFSVGHAKFWGIEPEDVGWESLGNITLNVELETFSFPMQIPIEAEQLKDMIDNQKIISPTGKIKIGREEGKITKVYVYGKVMDYPSFYDFYVTETENLNFHKKKFNEIIATQTTLQEFPDRVKFVYEEDEDSVYQITTNGLHSVHKKQHPRFIICFFTKAHPGIKPKESIIWKFYQSIFDNTPLAIWHAGEESSLEPTKIGNLEVYNQIKISDEFAEFSNSLLNQIQDTQSRKGKLLLQKSFCKLWRENVKCKHFKYLFDFLLDSIINKEIEYEFKQNEGILLKEDVIEFKSTDDVLGKPTKFAKEKLIPTIMGYIQDRGLKRYCVLYGIEDNSRIKPIYHLKSDQITEIEKMANNELKQSKIKISLQPIPFKQGIVLSVFIIPLFDKG